MITFILGRFVNSIHIEDGYKGANRERKAN